MSRQLPLGTSLKLAVVRKIHKGFVECEFRGHTGERSFKCTIPHPYAGKGSGIFTGIEKDSLVLVAKGPSERNFIVGIVPDKNYYLDQSGVEDTPYDTTSFPNVKEGEIVLKAGGKTKIDLSPEGKLEIDVGASDREADIELSYDTRTMFLRADNKYSFTEAGRTIEGIIKRDLHSSENAQDTSTVGFLSSVEYDRLLSEIGRSPADEVQTRTTTMSRGFVRNPALVEKRDIVYEYADSFGVSHIIKEALAMLDFKNAGEKVDNLTTNNGERQLRRTDVLNLNMFNYNHLIEKVEGTVVDIYGNVLDINRSVINVPDVDTIDTKNISTSDLQNIYKYLRRSIKYHMEINSRKELSGDEAEPSRSISGIGKGHSRWSIDVDGEGLTKINIPASSETGNIPILGRYMTSVQDTNQIARSGQYRDSKFVDIRMAPFAEGGQRIEDSEYKPATTSGGGTVTAGTAYHDLMNIASSIFSEGKFKNPAGVGSSVPPMEREINNTISGSGTPNAGGRSVHANLDGSLEMSIGADTIDKKSVVLDLEGAMIAHIGKDKNGRSIIQQTDGDVLLQIGGDDRSGHLEIHLKGSGGKSQKIIVDEMGITIDVEGNAIFNASGDMTVSAGGRLLMAGELIFMYGSADKEISGTRMIQGTERLVIRDGIPNMF